jgi:hypothetical protein
MRLFVLASTLCLLATIAVLADEEKEEKVPLKDLPKAVAKAIKKHFPDAKVVGASKEKEDGKLVYEIQLKVKKQNVEATFTPEGKLISVEKEITVADLPKAVRKEMDKRYPKAKVKKVEEVTKDKKVTYEVLLVTSEKKTFEALFDSDGKFIKEEEKKEKAKKEKE